MIPRVLPTDYTKLSSRERREVREQYVIKQKLKCHHCGYPVNGDPSPVVMSAYINTRLFPSNFFKYPVHLHHSHDTGFTIGAVHARCNAYLWQYLKE